MPTRRYHPYFHAALMTLMVAPCIAVPTGDANGDGKVNISDAILILQSVVGIRKATLEELKRADLDGNGRLDVADASQALRIGVGLQPPVIDSPARLPTFGLGTLKVTGDATHIRNVVPRAPNAIYVPQTLVSASGQFAAPEPDEPCDPPFTFGPFPVMAGGKLKASIDGEPPVPNVWSLGNWNSSLTVTYERRFPGGYRPPETILTLAGQVDDSHLSGTAEWPVEGRLRVSIGRPSGSGPLFGGCFDQSFAAKVEVTELRPDTPAQAGDPLSDGDSLKTLRNPLVFVPPDGGKVRLDPNTEIDFTGIQDGTPKLDNYFAELAIRLAQLRAMGLALPEGIEGKDFFDFLRATYDESTVREALQILNEFPGDPYEAAVLIKLLLDGNGGESVAKKLVGLLVDEYDLAGSIAKQLAKSFVPGIRILGMIDNVNDLGEILETYLENATVRERYREASAIYRESRGWTAGAMQSKVDELQSVIRAKQNEIDVIERDLMTEIGKIVMPDPTIFRRPTLNGQYLPGESTAWDNYYRRYGEAVAEARRKEAPLFQEIIGLRLKISVLRDYRAAKPSGAGALQALPGGIPALYTVARAGLSKGGVRYRGNGRGFEVAVLGAVVKGSGEWVARRDGEKARVFVVSGSAVVVGTVALTLRAGQALDLQEGKIVDYDRTGDDGGIVDGLPLRSLLLDDHQTEPYRAVTAGWSGGRVSDGWTLEDPGNDAKVETPEKGTLRLTVPDDNEIWDAVTKGPRLLHRITGDFDLEGEIRIETKASDVVATEFMIYSPGSYAGYLANQFRYEGLGAHYRILGGGWVASGGRRKLFALNRSFADGPDAPDGPVRLRLSRRGDLWRTYWSLDGVVWNLSTRQVIVVPDTLWVGWLAKRRAWDGLMGEPAITQLSGVRLETAKRGTMPQPQWDTLDEGGTARVDGATVRLALDGSKVGSARADGGRPLEGDFDLVVRYRIDPWTHESGDSRSVAFHVTGGDDTDYAYIGLAQSNEASRRYQSDMAVNRGWNRYQWENTADTGGRLRIRRLNGLLSTYLWSECRWRKLDGFTDGFDDPVFPGFNLSNAWHAGKAAKVSAEFTLERLAEGVEAWGEEPNAGCSVLEQLSPPEGLVLPAGTTATVLAAPFALGTLFFDASGTAFVFSNTPPYGSGGSHEQPEGRLLKIAPDGTAAVTMRSELLSGTNRKAGVALNDGFLLVIDYWPGGGNRYGGLFEVAPSGAWREWKTEKGHGGLSDIVPAPGGGWFLADFENDNLWLVPGEGQAESALLTVGDVPPGLGVLSFDEEKGIIRAVNWKGTAWPFGGIDGIYRIEEGRAILENAAPEGSSFGGLDMSRGGAFGRNLYASEVAGGRILRMVPDILSSDVTTPVITGLPNPGALRFNPLNGDLMVIFDGNRILRVQTGR